MSVAADRFAAQLLTDRSGGTPEQLFVNRAGAEDPEIAALVRRSAPAGSPTG